MPPKKMSSKTSNLTEIRDNETYQAMEPKEHILALPDTYIGGIEPSTIESIWVCNSDNEFLNKDIKVSLGFHNIFNEVLTNASDQCLRTREYEKKDKTVQITKMIKVTINKETGVISIHNDGDGIPVVEHEEKKIMIPELVFGQLLTSSNYNKEQKKTWGGRNGYGAKICLRKGTILPTFGGMMVLIEDIKDDDELIGDDGNPRKVLDKTTGYDKLFEITQHMGNPYVVNEEHILCLRMNDHKVIIWNKTNLSWDILWLNKEEKKIQKKSINTGIKLSVICPECNTELSGNLGHHYKRIHKNIPLPKVPRNSPMIISPDTPEVKDALLQMKKFAETIPDDNTLDISVKDFMKLNSTMKLRLSGYIGECVKWDKQDVELDPYVLGLWLGDGFKQGDIFSINSKDDPKILEYLENWAKRNDSEFKQTGKNTVDFNISSLSQCEKAPLEKLLSKYNLIKIKHIPKEYIINIREVRLKVLAGIIDSAGQFSREGTRITISQGMTHNHIQLAKDIVYLVRSLGFMCRETIKKTKWTWKGELKKGLITNMNISGNGIEDIPTLVYRKKCVVPKKHNTSSTGILKIKEVEAGEFIGIAVDGNHRFVLEDFTVTHNCNIYSTIFEVETVDHRRCKKFKQIWRNNMSEPEKKPKITEFKGKAYTKITFLPEYSRFGMPNGLDDDIIDLIRKRVYDIAGCSPRDVTVYFNEDKIEVKDFPQYVDKYIGKQKDGVSRVYEKPNEFWEVVACVSPDGNHKQVSLVNGICTINGGKHVDYVSNKICKDLVKKLNGKTKTGGIKSNHVKNNLWVFINSLIVNPSFSSQTKETLTTPSNKFGSSCDLSDGFINKLAKTEIAERAKLMKSFHDKSGLTKTDGKKTKNIRGIPKLDDANWAGTSKSSECTLILTEGDSAKALIISGLSVVGRDKYGVFPLRGKLLNVRDASDKQITGNAELQNLKKILGLQQNTTNIKDLRYGKVMLVTDQDLDGSHIKGLLMNMFEHYWENLLKEGFLVTMYTPIVKVRKGKKVVKVFYTQNAYEQWKNVNSLKGLMVKYYKGLGTSTKEEAKEYFTSLNIVDYTWCDNSKVSIDLAFNKKNANKRKKWLSFYDQNDVINPLDKKINFKDFINKDLIHFSNYDNHRSIPLIDGFKPSQRKAIYTFLKKNITSEMKVAQVTGLITAETLYHHGETSMEGTIVGMAQNFVGSNNINLLFPSGIFGSRLAGGADAAQSRYIFTNLEKIAKLIFRKEDDPLLTNLVEEGSVIEPKFFMPVIPMILVNGAHGIGTGFSTHVPCFNPKDIISNIRLMLEDKKIKPLSPWYRKFKGQISQRKEKGVKKWYTEGKWEFKSPTSLEITELPIGMWTDDYHHHLEDLIIDNSEKDPKKKKKQCITSYKKCNDHDDEKIHLILSFNQETLSELKGNLTKLKKTLKLEESKSCSVSNLHLFDPLGEIVKFNSPDAILRSYYRIRLPYYKKRREYQIKFLQREIKYLTAKILFVQGIIDETIIISKRPNEDILVELRDKHHLPPDPLNDDIVISPINDEVYKKALEGEVTRYCYDDSASDESSEDEDGVNDGNEVSDEDDNNEDESDSDSSEADSESDENKPENTTDDINGASPYSTEEDEKSVASLVLEEKQPETREVKKILSEDYGYLLTMHIWSLTQEKLNELEATCNKKKQDLDYMQKITPKDLWKLDLDELEKEL